RARGSPTTTDRLTPSRRARTWQSLRQIAGRRSHSPYPWGAGGAVRCPRPGRPRGTWATRGCPCARAVTPRSVPGFRLCQSSPLLVHSHIRLFECATGNAKAVNLHPLANQPCQRLCGIFFVCDACERAALDGFKVDSAGSKHGPEVVDVQSAYAVLKFGVCHHRGSVVTESAALGHKDGLVDHPV